MKIVLPMTLTPYEEIEAPLTHIDQGLMEQKGIHKTSPGEKPEPPSNGDDKEKVGLSEKIKNKLHIGSKDK